MKNQEKSLRIELQKLQEIGAFLHQIRTEKQISLDTVAAKTLIPKRLLVAIENGDVDELPEPFYIRALIIKFARTIDAELPEFTLVSTAKNTKLTSPSSKKNFFKKCLVNFRLRSLHLYLFYILLVGLSVRGIAGLVERPVVIEQASELNSEKASSVDANSTKEERITRVSPDFQGNEKSASRNSPTGDSLPALVVDRSSQSQGVMVGIDLEDRCWLKVVVDGQKVFEGTLPKGTKRTWTGEERVTIRAGNAGGVAVTFNNEKQQILGEPGQVQEVTYTVN
ncbi:helix-turn-helix domain-containing protein [Myxosarcina sp. GI1(2024)]